MVLFILGSVFAISLVIGVPISFCLGLSSLAVVLAKGEYSIFLVSPENIQRDGHVLLDGHPVVHFGWRPHEFGRRYRPTDPVFKPPGRAYQGRPCSHDSRCGDVSIRHNRIGGSRCLSIGNRFNPVDEKAGLRSGILYRGRRLFGNSRPDHPSEHYHGGVWCDHECFDRRAFSGRSHPRGPDGTISMMALIYYYAVKRNYPRNEKKTHIATGLHGLPRGGGGAAVAHHHPGRDHVRCLYGHRSRGHCRLLRRRFRDLSSSRR